VALSGRTYDVQDRKFGLSKLLAATWIDIVKRKLIALFDPKANPCHPVLLKMALV